MKTRHIMKTHKGFTLIELMIVVAIIAIISALALSSYNTSVRKARRSDAMDTLTKTAVDLERCFTANGTYLTTTSAPVRTCSVLDGSGALTTTPTNYTVSTKGFYTIAIPSGTPVTATTFTLTATAATADQRKDVQCYNMSITNTGAKTSADNANNDTTTTAGCWGH